MNNIVNRLLGMNSGTRKRTLVAVITAVLDFLTAFHIISFDDAQIASLQKIALTVLTAFVWGFASHYKNNDYTEEACEGTGYTRLLKDMKKPDVYTEQFEVTEELPDEGGDSIE